MIVLLQRDGRDVPIVDVYELGLRIVREQPRDAGEAHLAYAPIGGRALKINDDHETGRRLGRAASRARSRW